MRSAVHVGLTLWLDRDAECLAAEPHRGAVDDAPGELSAGRVDVIATGAANRRQHATLQQLVAKALDDGRRRASEVRAWEGVERNEVHLGRVPLEEARQSARLRRGVVYALEHYILKGHAAPVLLIQVVPARLQQLGDGVFAIDRHQLVA